MLIRLGSPPVRKLWLIYVVVVRLAGNPDCLMGFKYDRAVRTVAVVTLCLFVLYGILITCIPILPFWIDEWLLIDNLKFKSPGQLWYHLERTQQFPRVYLEIIKAFSAACDYSYTSLRLPSFLAHFFGLVILYRLSAR